MYKDICTSQYCFLSKIHKMNEALTMMVINCLYTFCIWLQWGGVLAQIYIFTIYPGPKFTQPTFTQNPNLHNTKFTPDPNLHDPKFTPPQIYKTQIYTNPDIQILNFTQSPNWQNPKFTQSQNYNTKICIKLGQKTFIFKGMTTLLCPIILSFSLSP